MQSGNTSGHTKIGLLSSLRGIWCSHEHYKIDRYSIPSCKHQGCTKHKEYTKTMAVCLTCGKSSATDYFGDISSIWKNQELVLAELPPPTD